MGYGIAGPFPHARRAVVRALARSGQGADQTARLLMTLGVPATPPSQRSAAPGGRTPAPPPAPHARVAAPEAPASPPPPASATGARRSLPPLVACPDVRPAGSPGRPLRRRGPTPRQPRVE